MGAWLADCIADRDNENKEFASFQNCEDTITVTVDAGEGRLRPVRAKFWQYRGQTQRNRRMRTATFGWSCPWRRRTAKRRTTAA